MTRVRRRQVREILESVLRVLRWHVTVDRPMSMKDGYRAFRLAAGSAEAGGRRGTGSATLLGDMTPVRPNRPARVGSGRRGASTKTEHPPAPHAKLTATAKAVVPGAPRPVAGVSFAAVLEAAAAAGVVWHERNDHEAKGAPCPVCGKGGRDRLRVRRGDEGVAVACSGCGSGAEFRRRFTRSVGFRWTARRPSREARRAARVAELVRSTSARTKAGRDGPTQLAWAYGLDGWRWEGGDEIKAAGEVLRPSAHSYLSYRIGGWSASRPWPAAIREIPRPGLREWQAVTGRYWPVELSCIGVLLFGFFASGEADPGALQAEAYTRDGRRVPHRVDGENVQRWTLGTPEGRVFRVAPASASPIGVAICEGPTAALAIAAVRPRTLVLAVGGALASSVLPARGHLPRGLPVRLYGARGAHAAARAAGEDLAALGYDVERPWLPPLDAPSACDFADYRAERGRGEAGRIRARRG